MPPQNPIGWDMTGKPIYAPTQTPTTTPTQNPIGWEADGTPIYDKKTSTQATTASSNPLTRLIGGFLTGSGVAGLVDLATDSNTYLHPIDTATGIAKNVVAPLGRLANVPEAYRKGGVEGAANEVSASIPILGPAAEHASQRMQSGDTAGGLGEVAGMMAAPFMAEGATKAFPAVKSAMEARKARNLTSAVSDAKMALDLMKAIPPSVTKGYAAADVQRAAPYLASEHAVSPIVDTESLVSASNSAITQIEEHVASYINAHPKDLIETNPLESARRALASSERGGDMAKGMKALDDLGLDKPLTVAEADAKRLRLNAENKSALQQTQSDVETQRRVDPAFAAREAASEALRDGVYGKLESRGIEGVRDLRLDEGALIKIRNSAERYLNKGDRNVGGTGSNTVTAKVIRGGSTAAGSVAGGYVGGPIGIVAGGVVGSKVGEMLAPGNLTRDALIERAFSKVKGASKVYPTIPEDAPIAGHLQAPPTPMGTGRADASYVRSVPATVQATAPQRMLAEPSHRTIPLGSGPDASHVTTIPARGIVVRDPVTGRFKRVYTTEGAR